MRLKVKEFFKINNVLDVKANTKELFIIVFCEGLEVKLYYNSVSYLKHDLTFINKCGRGEFN